MMTTHLGNEMFCSTFAGTPAKKKKKRWQGKERYL